jgi:hypothetical protein
MTLTGPALAGGHRIQPVQQHQRRPGAFLRQQHPRQHQILRLPLVCQLVTGTKAALLYPAGSRGDIALGQHQPRPLRRDR